jgi:hypothetical protein
VEIAKRHMSWVLLACERACKLRKPVLGNVHAGGVGELERLGGGARTVDKFAPRRDQRDAHTSVGKPVQGQQRLEPGHPRRRR